MQKIVHTPSGEIDYIWRFYHQNNFRLIRASLYRLVIATAIAIACLVGVQLVYPQGRALPFARLENGAWVGFQSPDKITAKLQSVNNKSITVIANTTEIVSSVTGMGIAVDAPATIGNLTDYSWRQRLVPFSMFSKTKKLYPIFKKYEQPKLAQFAASFTTIAPKAPKDAGLKLERSKVTVLPAENGYKFEQQDIETQLREVNVASQDRMLLRPKAVLPKISNQTARATANSLQARINSPITIIAVDKTTVIEPATIASWIIITPTPDKGVLAIAFDTAKIKTALTPFANTVYLAPTPTTVAYVDGRQNSQQTGSPGQSLLLDDLVTQVSQVANTTTTKLTGQTTNVPVVKIYDRSYTRSSAGLQALLDYWVQNHRGVYGIELRSLDGNIRASINPDKQFTSASVYKMYIAHLIYDRINAGTLSGSTITSTGLTIDTCIYKMIHLSDNACASAMGDIVGWNNSDAVLHAQGFESTTLAYEAQLTTANDAADWMAKLLDGSLVADTQRNNLINLMEHQIYRYGIPAGSKGMVVADKLGELYGLFHDVAIVYHPKGTYILSVFSDGSSAANVADLASQISKVMNQ
jgi:hypothetical protein